MKIVAGVLLFGTLVMEGSNGGFPVMGTKKKEEGSVLRLDIEVKMSVVPDGFPVGDVSFVFG